MNKVKCQWCGHEWNSKSKCKLVTCSSCGYKTKRRDEADEQQSADSSHNQNKKEDQTNGKPNQTRSPGS